ncbi:hypothetical protein JCM16303_001506 [Sporobolomyces ruberrimus]
MTFQTIIQETAGRIGMTIVSLVLPPLVVLAYKYRRGVKLSHWMWWFIADLFLWVSGLGGTTPLWAGVKDVWNGAQWVDIGVQSILPYVTAIAIAIFCVWETEVTGHRSSGTGDGRSSGGMDDNRDMEDLGGMDDGRKGFSLSKGERKHLEKVAKARAKAARQTKREVAELV